MENDKLKTSDGFSAGGVHGAAADRSSLDRSKEVRIPNAETREAIEQARTRKGLASYDSVEDMMADLDDA